jgi:signal transduction histidine kinase
MKWPGFLNLRGIGGQIAALVVVSIVALHTITTAAFLFHRPDQLAPPGDISPTQLATVARLLGEASPSERPRLLTDVARAFPQFDIQDLASVSAPSASEPEAPHLRGLYRRLGPSYRIVTLARGDGVRRIGIALPDGAMISASIATDRPSPPIWGSPWMITLLFAVISVTLFGLWAARTLTAPLTSFAKAAESFSLEGDATSLPERGPEEVRSLAKALNRMRKRITDLIDDRTRMLAAISHDLRTPITRLRLRCEFIEDETHRGRMLADLDQMRSMLESVLSFLRNSRKLEAMTLVDVASTLQLVADQFSDMGHKVSCAGPDHAMATARPDDLLRGVTNIVENAVRYGAEVVIRLTVLPDHLVIDVEDDGPGISDAKKHAMLEPFARGDDARNMDEATGFGLGLSIAGAIVAAHGGALSLHDRTPCGLVVSIRLPVRQQRLRQAASGC